jgi:hypothetical protein
MKSDKIGNFNASKIVRNVVVLSVLLLSFLAHAEIKCTDPAEGILAGCPRMISEDGKCKQVNPHFVAFDDGYCLGKQPGLIDEIVSLPWVKADRSIGFLNLYEGWQELPTELMLGNDTRSIARSLIFRQFNIREKQRALEMNQDSLEYSLFEDTKIVMTVPSTALNSIRKHGFLNYHQTHSTTAFADEKWRRETESLFFRLRFPIATPEELEISNELLPKYAYVIPRAGVSNLGPSVMLDYSDTIIVFKDSVKLQSTLTDSDSLFGSGQTSLQNTADLPMFLPPLTFYSLDHRTFREDGSVMRSDPLNNRHTYGKNYIEAQIWGRLTFADVDYVIVGCYKSPKERELKKILSAIPRGISVYRCAQDWSRSRNQYEKGDPLR